MAQRFTDLNSATEFASSDAWVVWRMDRPNCAAAFKQRADAVRYLNAHPEQTLRIDRAPDHVDDQWYVWAVMADGGIVAGYADPDAATEEAIENGGWLSLVRISPGKRVHG